MHHALENFSDSCKMINYDLEIDLCMQIYIFRYYSHSSELI